VFTSALAAYACAILRVPGQRVWFALFVATMMVPFQVTMIPNYLLLARLELLNTYTALIAPQVVTGYGIFMLRQTFKNLPGSLVQDLGCVRRDRAVGREQEPSPPGVRDRRADAISDLHGRHRPDGRFRGQAPHHGAARAAMALGQGRIAGREGPREGRHRV